ncbi:MAG TPA: hypothetical protein VF516_37760 [Kofleriaceae bacterium]
MAGNGVDIVRTGTSVHPAVEPAIDMAEQVPAEETLHVDPVQVDPAPVNAAPVNPTLVYAFLGFLVALDVVLATCALAFPQTWFAIMHGSVVYDDPAGLLYRTGAVWVAFTLLQAIALVRWRRAPYWLALVAGVRLTELFSDWATLAAAQHVTRFAWLALLTAPLSNLLFGWFLIATYRRLDPTPPHPGFTPPAR